VASVFSENSGFSWETFFFSTQDWSKVCFCP
jgi:hypothetical protein